MKNQNRKIPKIRFESFEKRWESYRLSEYSSYRRGSFPQPYGNKEWYGGKNAMPFVQVVDVLENLRLAADTKQKISTLAQPMSVFAPSDSVIVTLQGSIGRVAITQYDAYVDRTILIFEDYISQTNKEFWAYTIRNKFEIERQKAPGGTIKTITKEALSDFKVSIPNYSEQSAIGSLFRTLDDLVASYKDNLANYQALKATMLSKMFPKAGQTVPEIRLDGFEGEWETKILSEVTNITMGQSPKSENYTDNPNDYILIQGNADIKDKKVVPRLWTTEVTKMAEIGDIILTVRAPVGDIGKTEYNVVIGRGVAAIKGNDFIFYTLEKMKMIGFWNRFSTGSTFESISSNDIREAIIQIPTLKEQQAIGTYFSNLDNLINSYQEKITKLETLKKKLLQDMFI